MPEPLDSSAENAAGGQPSVNYPYLEQLTNGVLTSPVPDYASTLVTQAEQDVEDENLRFLRGDLTSLEESSSDGSGLPWSTTPPNMRRSPAPRRYTPAQLHEFNELEERAQEVIQQEYNGWAPGAFDSEDDDQPPIATYPSNLEPGYVRVNDVSGDALRNRMRWRRLRDHFTSNFGEGSISHFVTPESTQRQPSRFVENGMASSDSSLRTQAMMHAVRQNTQMSPRTRSQLQRVILDREQTGLDAERSEHDGNNSGINSDLSQLSPSQRRQIQQEYLQNRQLYAQHQQRRNEMEQRRNIIEQSLRQHVPFEARRRRIVPSPHPPANGISVENTVRYLESLRLCESEKESRDTADESGFDPRERCPHNSDDFLLDTSIIPPPPRTSWLQIGSVLSGIQHAMPARSVSHDPPRFSTERSRIRQPTLSVSSALTTSPVRTPDGNTMANLVPLEPNGQPQEAEDQWPVKVTIHGVDYDEMTLTGTMEACDVPEKAAPSKTSNITTYLEGEIIDFNTYTLVTKNFKSNYRVDGIYWRKLPPFRDMKDEETVARCLLSRDWLKNDLMQNWVLMRWKEKHFVTPSEAESSLTISGFYYVSLRRLDGCVEGLYYDPSSTPYQHLSLRPKKRTFPAYEFR